MGPKLAIILLAKTCERKSLMGPRLAIILLAKTRKRKSLMGHKLTIISLTRSQVAKFSKLGQYNLGQSCRRYVTSYYDALSKYGMGLLLLAQIADFTSGSGKQTASWIILCAVISSCLLS